MEGTGIVPVYVAVFENTEIDETAATAGYRTWLDIQADHTGAGYYRARRIVALPRPPKQTITGIVEQMPASGTVNVMGNCWRTTTRNGWGRAVGWFARCPLWAGGPAAIGAWRAITTNVKLSAIIRQLVILRVIQYSFESR